MAEKLIKEDDEEKVHVDLSKLEPKQKCRVCGKKFQLSDDVKSHMKGAHADHYKKVVAYAREEQESLKSLVDSIQAGEIVATGDIVNQLLSNKVAAAVEDRKVALAQGMFGDE